MILISVKSEVVNDKRQFKSDRSAMIFLRKIDRLHMSHRMKLVGKRPRGGRGLAKLACEKWRSELACAIPLRIEIINTKYNQLNLPL